MNDAESDAVFRDIEAGAPAIENVLGVVLGALLAIGIIVRLVLLLT